MRGTLDTLGVAAVTAGWIVFFAAMARRRLLARDASVSGRRDSLSIAGIALQAAALAVTWAGQLRLDAALRVTATSAAIVMLVAASVFLFVWSVRVLGENWSLMARMRGAHQLVTHGPFALVRHPIYVAVFGMMIAGAAAVGHLHTLVAAIPLYAAGTALRVRAEERLLKNTFGADYAAYAGRVKRFLPGVF